MDSDKNLDFENAEEPKENEMASEGAPRARNRTVLLTPEITNQVRARLAQQGEQSATPTEALGYNLEENSGYGSGFVPVGQRRTVTEAPHSQTPRFSQVMAAPVATAEATAQAAHFYSAPNRTGELSKDAVVWAKLTPVVGCLVSFDVDANGELFVLRSGRLIVTSQQPPGGSYLLLQDESVSVMHAILRVSEVGEIQVLDQLSEFGSAIKRFGTDDEVRLSGDKCSLEHGDVIRFGSRSFHVCILARPKVA